MATSTTSLLTQFGRIYQVLPPQLRGVTSTAVFGFLFLQETDPMLQAFWVVMWVLWSIIELVLNRFRPEWSKEIVRIADTGDIDEEDLREFIHKYSDDIGSVLQNWFRSRTATPELDEPEDSATPDE